METSQKIKEKCWQYYTAFFKGRKMPIKKNSISQIVN